MGFFYGLRLDMEALSALLPHLLFSKYKKDLKPVSICTGIKNRTSNYLEYVLTSILEMDHQDLVELSVYDCGSDDFETLEKEIRQKWKGKLKIVSKPAPFTRSASFNHAIAQASNELFFVTDADMSLPKDLVILCNKYVTSKTAWFPIVFTLFEKRPAIISNLNGRWLPAGLGMFASTKDQFEKAGKYNTAYTEWGIEDNELWINYFKAGILPIRSRCRGLIHHWHPSLQIKTVIPDHLEKYLS